MQNVFPRLATFSMLLTGIFSAAASAQVVNVAASSNYSEILPIVVTSDSGRCG